MFDDLKSLAIFNCITFIQSTHAYLINGRPSAKVSVTGLLNKYKPVFEVDKWAAIKAEQRNITPSEIKEEWRLNNLYATTRGTIFHSYAENYFNNKVIPYNKDEVQRDLGTEMHNQLREELVLLIKQFNNFYNEHQHLIPVKQELVIGDINDTKICGMLDMLVYNTKTDGYEIYDYKTNKEIDFSSKFAKKFYEPISHLDVCEFNTYRLQLSLYKHIIEKYTTIKITGTYVVWFNVKNESYKLIPLTDVDSEVCSILEHYAV
jgi:ATP-dependent exoDNAse (exonuclease V) beta subunit